MVGQLVRAGEKKWLSGNGSWGVYSEEGINLFLCR